jgi:heme-degrading monooxygenase HmoA
MTAPSIGADDPRAGHAASAAHDGVSVHSLEEVTMLARLWHGRVPSLKADAYEAYLNRSGIPDYLATPGNRGVTVLRRSEADVTHFLLISLWDSLSAIEAFAGTPVEAARYYPEDDDFLLEREPAVVHYDVGATVGPL